MKRNERKRSKSYEYFDHIDESPEDLTKTLLATPTKKKEARGPRATNHVNVV